MPKAHVSIHDVAPHTLVLVEDLISMLQGVGVDRVMLLVIPGLSWSESNLDVLRSWVDQGHLLAGHGRVHHVASADSLYHKAHSFLISRNVAEHLSKTEDEIFELMRENHEWFMERGLPSPSHYVPPAWALGSISRSRLRDLPFETVEVLRGVIHVQSGTLYRMPLLGYEADTAFRAFFLKVFNRWNSWSARKRNRAARISIHPNDLEFRLGHRISEDCERFHCQPDVSSLIP